MESRPTVLEEAIKLVDSDRDAIYGPPKENLGTIAGLWREYLEAKHKEQILLTAADVAMMMILLKVGREAYHHKRDNLVDIAGYARCGERCE